MSDEKATRSETKAPSSTVHVVEPSSSSSIQVVPFCVDLPSSSDRRDGSDGGATSSSSTITPSSSSSQSSTRGAIRRRGVVGTVTFLDKSAMVWFGWGTVEEDVEGENQDDRRVEMEGRTTGTGLPVMGPLVVSMPRTKYVGPGGGEDAPCSQLIGGDNEEDQMLGWQMASRLSRSVGWPVYVSGTLGGGGGVDAGGSDMAAVMGGLEGLGGDTGYSGSLPQKVAALAEREVRRILLERKRYLEEVEAR